MNIDVVSTLTPIPPVAETVVRLESPARDVLYRFWTAIRLPDGRFHAAVVLQPGEVKERACEAMARHSMRQAVPHRDTALKGRLSDWFKLSAMTKDQFDFYGTSLVVVTFTSEETFE